MVESESQQLDEQMEMLYTALLRLDTETENDKLKDWVRNICDPQYGVIDGLVANFIDFVDDEQYVTKILKILKYGFVYNVLLENLVNTFLRRLFRNYVQIFTSLAPL